jgi:hypothetical protein
MQLVAFEHGIGYNFRLTFANGENIEVDLKELIFNYVDLNSLSTAKINSEWGCLEFKAGMVDVEPKTLYKYATNNRSNQVTLL